MLNTVVSILSNNAIFLIDDDTEAQGKEEPMNDQDCDCPSGSETRKSLAGMKRPIES